MTDQSMRPQAYDPADPVDGELPEFMRCESGTCGRDYDGSTIDMPCGEPATVTVLIREHFNPWPPHEPYLTTLVLCRDHLTSLANDADDEGRFGWENSSEIVTVQLDAVWPSSEWDPQLGDLMLAIERGEFVLPEER